MCTCCRWDQFEKNSKTYKKKKKFTYYTINEKIHEIQDDDFIKFWIDEEEHEVRESYKTSPHNDD